MVCAGWRWGWYFSAITACAGERVCHGLWRPLDEWFWVGVDLFFVLSGFLITGILYDSLRDPHYFRNFYVRRALRIFPIFYGFFLALLLLKPLLHLQMDRGMWAFPFYVGNLTMPFSDLGHHDPSVITMGVRGHIGTVGNISHLWSLCVEEQFYLIWPAVVLLVRDRKRLMQLCVVLSVVTLALRVFLYAHLSQQMIDNMLIFRSTYTRWDTLLVGSWLALFLRGKALSPVQVRRSSAWLFWVCAGLLGGGEFVWGRGGTVFTNPFTQTVGYTLFAFAAAAVVLIALDDNSLVSRAMRTKWISELGVVSYGFYFYHLLDIDVLIRLARKHPGASMVIPFVAFGVTLGVAWLSFRYFETPFLRLKRVLAPEHVGTEAKGFVPVRLHVSEPEVG